HRAELAGAREIVREEQIAVLDARPAIVPGRGATRLLHGVEDAIDRPVPDAVEEELIRRLASMAVLLEQAAKRLRGEVALPLPAGPIGVGRADEGQPLDRCSVGDPF